MGSETLNRSWGQPFMGSFMGSVVHGVRDFEPFMGSVLHGVSDFERYHRLASHDATYDRRK